MTSFYTHSIYCFFFFFLFNVKIYNFKRKRWKYKNILKAFHTWSQFSNKYELNAMKQQHIQERNDTILTKFLKKFQRKKETQAFTKWKTIHHITIEKENKEKKLSLQKIQIGKKFGKKWKNKQLNSAFRKWMERSLQLKHEERVLRSAIQMMTRFETKKNQSKFTRWYRYT